MRFQVLGPLAALGSDGPVALGGPKERAVLAHLLAVAYQAAGQDVSLDALVDTVWGDQPPRTAAKSLQTYVLRLRNALGPEHRGLVVTRGRGYRAALDGTELDATAFEKMAATGYRELRAGRHTAAAATLRSALSLWRGEAFPEIAHTDTGRSVAARLGELRLVALEHRVDADLAGDLTPAIVAELTELVAEHPVREQFWAQLMLAQYRLGRQAEALATYRRAHQHLAGELGIEPGPRLRELHTAVLRHDPALARPVVPGPLTVNGTGLVGRDAELTALRSLWSTAAGQGVHLVGARGIGKTRLVAALAADVRESGRTVHYTTTQPTVPGGDLLIVDGGPVCSPDGWAMVVVTGDPGRPTPDGWRRVELGPLTRAALADLVQDWGAPAHLAARAGGNPGIAHDLAQAYLRDQVDRAVRSSAAGRKHLAAARDVLASRIAGVTGLDQPPPLDHGHCPYPGLAAFGIDDAPDFHGREHLVAHLLARLATTRLLGVVGPSGSGKSSLVRAGLLAALRRDALPGSASLPLTVIRPGADPMAALRQVTGGVVFVDQFEEIFTVCADPAPFVDALLTDPGLTVVVAIRADYYGHCAAYPELAARLAEEHVLVGPMREAELLRAIERPAHRMGVRLADGLADTLAGAVVDRPGALPLLSVTLRELWDQRVDGVLTMRAYAEAGGVEGAVARLAERAYDRLTAQQRETARTVLLRLTGPGEGEEIVRRRVSATELADLSVPDVDRVVEVFTEARVLTVGDGRVEMAHEALLRHWPRLRTWLDEDAEGRAVHRKLTAAAAAWLDGGREQGDVYRGARLVSALDWAETNQDQLTGTEAAFLGAARDLAESETARARARNRRLRLLALALVVLLLAALAGTWFAVRSQRRADAASVAADARRLGAQALIERDIGLAMLLAVRAVRLDPTAQTRGNLLATMSRSPDLVGATGVPGGDRMLALTANPAGTLLAAGSFSGQIRLHSAETLKVVGTVQADGHRPVMGLAFDADGRRLVSWGASNGILVWDVDRREPVGPAFGPAGEASGTLTADGRSLVLCHASSGAVTRWDLRSTTSVDLMPPGSCDRATGSPDRRTLIVATARDTTLINLETGARQAFPVGNGAALSPDGGTLAATPGDNGEVQLWDVAAGRMRASARRHTAAVMTAAWSPDGRTFASGANDRLGIVWDAATSRPVHVLSGHSGRLMNQVYAPGGGSLFTAALDGSLLAWDLTGTRGLRHRISPGAPGAGYRMAIPDGTRVISLDASGAVLLDAHSGAVLSRIATGPATGADVWSGTLAVSYQDGTAGLFDLADGRRRHTVGTPGDPATSVAIGPDILALARERPDGTGSVELPGRPYRLSTPAPVAELRFTPDQRSLIAGLVNGQAAAWDLADGRRTALLDVHPRGFPVWTFAFSPDGTAVAMGGVQGRPSVWRIDGWQRQWQAVVGHNGYDLSLAFSPDGRTLASSGTDSLTFLYDVASGDLIGNAIGDADNVDTFAHFLPGGTTLATVDSAGAVSHWDADPESWARRACAIAGRDLTPDEWRQFLPTRLYARTC